MATLGEKIRKLRLQARLTVYELADRANIPAQAIYNWERGSSSPVFTSLARLAQALGVSLSEFDGCTPPNDFRHRVKARVE
jgi:transcriptional regulator with XRE-family HTH domain